jgi:hypothetical protein
LGKLDEGKPGSPGQIVASLIFMAVVSLVVLYFMYKTVMHREVPG